MGKIRINELARELEVKAHEILDLLPELGVTEKKTHSSSVDEETAVKLRRHYGRDVADAAPAPERSRSSSPTAVAEMEEEAAKPEPAARPAERREEAPAAQPNGQPKASPVADAAPHAEPAPASTELQTKREEPPAADTEKPAGHAAAPIRPPLAGRPVLPPIGAHAPTIPPRPPSPQPPAAVIAPGRPVAPPPSRPAPSPTPQAPAAHQGPRPGQVLSGPRAPMPAAPSETARASTPAMPRPPAPRPASPSVSNASPARPLAGQPIARPVVPPRPDLAARLGSPRPAMPAAPAPPRPGAPKPPSSPIPGQPIYRGPIRPGQPIVTRQSPTGPPRPGGPGSPMRPGGPRPQHPTSRGRLEPGLPPPPVEAPRGRPGEKPRARQPRERTEEERILRPQRRQVEAGPPPISREIVISEGITVKELSEKLDVKAALVMKKLMDRGIFVAINQTLDSKLATDISREFGASTATVTYEEESMQQVEEAQTETDLQKRAPVVTIMGHVDHGKTSLLDAIREANVAAREAGGITQHIGAYQVEMNGRKIVFIDTPGHEAFTRMRSRGAKVTDVVILVVAADDGVMPQTLEAIDHAKAAKVPIIVAINKIDKPDSQPDRIKQQLSDRGLLAEDWGGDTVMVPVSAKTHQNLELLLEMILLVADLQDLKANPNRPAMGTVIEAQLDRGRGPVATVLVRNGTLAVGDFFICGAVFGKVRAMLNDRGVQIRKAEPSTPVEVLGLDSLPEAGDDFQVVTDTAKAKQIVGFRDLRLREASLAKNSRLTLEQLHKKMEAGEVKELPLIIKADVGGSAEVLTETLQKLSNDKVKVRVIHSGVGAITESDVLLATASNAIVVGFNVRPERNAAAVAEQEQVDIRLHTIIYNLTDEIKRAMTGLLEPVFKEVYKGRAEVRETFRITKVGAVAGCLVVDGSITSKSEVRLLRDNVVVHTGKIGSLRRFKDDVSEVKANQECGITLDNYSDVKQGDVIEAFVTERVATEVFA
jgi:translation initiation factor IF-2